MIQTVTGKIDKNEIKNVFMHEHIQVSALEFSNTFGKRWLDKEKLLSLSVDVLRGVEEKFGVNLWVDGTPIDLGRDVNLLKEASEKSGVRIVASTGLYNFPSSYTIGNSAEDIADWFIYECENAIDGTDIKPGILKAAADGDFLTDDEIKRMSAMGMVQVKTSLPIYVHSHHKGDTAHQQIDILFNKGVKPEKVIIGHTALNHRYEYVKGLLDRGCYVSMDQCHCVAEHDEIGKTLARLWREGYGSKLVLANDLCIYSNFAQTNATGMHLTKEQHIELFGILFDKIMPEFLKAGGTEEQWHKMLRENAISALEI